MKITFGIVSTKDSGQYLDQVIESIHTQGIPREDYEVMVVGGDDPGGVRHYSDDAMTLSQKKNLIGVESKYDTVALLHDYFEILPGFYDAYRRLGEDWDVSVPKIATHDGYRYRDWMIAEGSITGSVFCGQIFRLDYNVTDRTHTQYVSGGFFLVKKQWLLDHKLPSHLDWGESEDIFWSFECRSSNPPWRLKLNKNAMARVLKTDKHNYPPTQERLL